MARVYDLGPFRLDADLGALTRAGAPTMLGARAVGVLTVLVERAHEFVAKERLIDAAWPGVIVEEGNLPVQVHAIRRALGQAPGGERWIETLARRGYRFVGPVSVAADKGRDAYESGRSNLPERLTSFVGRERDLVEIKRLLPGKRLITLVGAGGIGKTRLALQVAAEVTSAYRDGAWFVDLGSLRDGSLVTAAVAQALGVQERAGKPLANAICAHLRRLQLLLILDNCEHLLDACASLVDALLKGTAETTIVATSREPLRAAAEQVYPLPPLSLPQPDATIDAVQRSEAAQLLVQRVREQLPDFELTANRVPPITELCIHLDGIPLALELAAARARSLSIEQINVRLGQRFRLLTSGARAALPRQQTLRATLDWSYDLLGEDERVVLRRLAVFAGSFAVEAGCAVASDAGIDEFAVIDILSQLVARSLIVAETAARGARYRLLETTRAYALEKLAEAEEAASVTRAHAEYFHRQFARAPDDWLRMPDTQWQATYVAELDHVRAALDWTLATDGEAATAVALAGASAPLWTVLSLYGEGTRRMEAARARIGSDTPPADEARLWLWLGLLTRPANPTGALAAFEQAVSLYRSIDWPLELAHAGVRFARALALAGRFEASASALEEASLLLRGCAVPKLLGLYHGSVASLKVLTGDPTGARAHFETALTSFRDAGSETSALESISNLADVAWTLGDLDAAEASLREYIAMRGMPCVRRTGIGFALGNLAGVLTERGDLEGALNAAREGLPLLAEAGHAWPYMDHLAVRAALAGKHRDAALLSAYADATYAAKQSTRPPNEARACERVHSILRETLAGDELERLYTEGANLSEADACRLALES